VRAVDVFVVLCPSGFAFWVAVVAFCLSRHSISKLGTAERSSLAGTRFGSGPELGFEPSQKTIGMAVAPKLVPPNTNAEYSAIKGSEDEDSKERV
jgi:hypothetical protein